MSATVLMGFFIAFHELFIIDLNSIAKMHML